MTGDGADTPAWRRAQPLGLWWLLALGLLAGLGVMLVENVRVGGYAMAGVLALCAALRLVLPRGAVGGLFVRSRGWDAITLLALAGGLTLLSATVVLR